MAASGLHSSRGPIRTRSVSPVTASAGRLSRGKAPSTHGVKPVPQYKERAKTLKADQTRIRNMERKRIAAMLGAAGGGGAGGNPYSALAEFPTGPPAKAPRVPRAPVGGNPYAGTATAIGKFTAQAQARMRNDARAAKASMRGKGDAGVGIAGSFDAQLAGHAAEVAAIGSSLRNQARAKYAEAELDRRGALAKAKYDQRLQQMKLDAEAAQGQQLSTGMMTQLAAEGIDPTPFLNNPVAAAITLGRLRYARRQETSLPATAWAQAAQYGLRPPNEYGSAEEFQWELGKARSGQYGSNDAVALIAALQQAGLLQGLTP